LGAEELGSEREGIAIEERHDILSRLETRKVQKGRICASKKGRTRERGNCERRKPDKRNTRGEIVVPRLRLDKLDLRRSQTKD
jgi:hypothetical protein